MALGHDGLLHEVLGLLANLFLDCPSAQKAFVSSGNPSLLQRTLNLVFKPSLDLPTFQVQVTSLIHLWYVCEAWTDACRILVVSSMLPQSYACPLPHTLLAELFTAKVCRVFAVLGACVAVDKLQYCHPACTQQPTMYCCWVASHANLNMILATYAQTAVYLGIRSPRACHNSAVCLTPKITVAVGADCDLQPGSHSRRGTAAAEELFAVQDRAAAAPLAAAARRPAHNCTVTAARQPGRAW